MHSSRVSKTYKPPILAGLLGCCWFQGLQRRLAGGLPADIWCCSWFGGVEVGIVGDAAVFVGAGSVSVVVERGGFDIDAFACRGGFAEGGEHVMERIHVICHVRCVYEQFLATLCAFGKIKKFGYLGAIAAFGADPREMWLVPQHAFDCSLDFGFLFL